MPSGRELDRRAVTVRDLDEQVLDERQAAAAVAPGAAALRELVGAGDTTSRFPPDAAVAHPVTVADDHEDDVKHS